MIRPATMTHGWFLLKGACRRREQEGGGNDVVVAAPSSGASRHNTLVRETALVFVICAAVACGTGPAAAVRRSRITRDRCLFQRHQSEPKSENFMIAKGFVWRSTQKSSRSWKSAGSLTGWPRLPLPRGSTPALRRTP
jgi:hypothetical protein